MKLCNNHAIRFSEVWCLPSSLKTSQDNEVLRAGMLAIGEPIRVTLKFPKP